MSPIEGLTRLLGNKPFYSEYTEYPEVVHPATDTRAQYSTNEAETVVSQCTYYLEATQIWNAWVAYLNVTSGKANKIDVPAIVAEFERLNGAPATPIYNGLVPEHQTLVSMDLEDKAKFILAQTIIWPLDLDKHVAPLGGLEDNTSSLFRSCAIAETTDSIITDLVYSMVEDGRDLTSGVAYGKIMEVLLLSPGLLTKYPLLNDEFVYKSWTGVISVIIVRDKISKSIYLSSGEYSVLLSDSDIDSISTFLVRGGFSKITLADLE